MNPQPKTPQPNPYKAELKAGKTYFWCSCGLSSRQPFCDGSHKQTGDFAPIKWIAEKNAEIWLCGCKHSKHPPLCDGSHSTLD